MSSTITSVKLSDIFYDEIFNSRGEFTRQSVYELAQSIKANSLITPIILRLGVDAGIQTHKYHLVAGHRRYKAIEWWLNWDRIPAIIKPGLSDEAAHILNLTENIEREDLTYVEEGLAIQATFSDMSLREIGLRLNRSPFWIKQRFDLIKLSPKIQRYVTDGRLSLRDVELLLKLNPSEREIEVEIMLARKERGEATSISARRGRIRKVSEIKQMVAKMMKEGASGIATMALAWAMGNLTDAEFETGWRDWRDENVENDSHEYVVDNKVSISGN